MVTSLFDRLRDLARATGDRVGVFYIDLDQFKAINDTLGHQHGDMILKEVARRLLAVSTVDDAALRIGGDEFLFLAHEAAGRVRLEEQAHSLQLRLSVPVSASDRHLKVTPSIGLACYPEHGDDAEALMRFADWAMYEAKSRSRDRCHVFDAQLRERMEREVRLVADLKEAGAREQFDVHFQARHSVRLGRTVSVEALARWHHPALGMVPAGEFIPLCERAGLVNMLGHFVLRRAMQQSCAWRQLGIDVTIAVNVSLNQLVDARFASDVRQLFHVTGCDPHRIELEITESLLADDNPVVHDNLRQLRELGVRIAIDDFGTGYSNMSRLSVTDIDCIKIDRSLIVDLPRNAAIVETIIALCRVIKATIVAEGVETTTVADWLDQHGCDQMQGYYFGHPVAAAVMQEELLAQYAAEAEIIRATGTHALP